MTVTSSTEVLIGLQRIRVRRRLMWGVWLGFLPILILLSFSDVSRLAEIIAPAWMALIVVTSALVLFSKCPRCDSLFHTTVLWRNVWAKKCIHCGLPLGR
jgi:hypothetical protein